MTVVQIGDAVRTVGWSKRADEIVRKVTDIYRYSQSQSGVSVKVWPRVSPDRLLEGREEWIDIAWFEKVDDEPERAETVPW